MVNPIQSLESRVCEYVGLGSPLRDWNGVQPSGKPVEQRAVRLFLALGRVFFQNTEARASVLGHVCCPLSGGVLLSRLGHSHVGLVLLVRGVPFADENNQHMRSHRSFFTSWFAFTARLRRMFHLSTRPPAAFWAIIIDKGYNTWSRC